MVICCVVGCSNRSGRDKVRFFRIPTVRSNRPVEQRRLEERRRREFLAAIGRKDLVGSKLRNARICSEHFVSGKPAGLFESGNPDWVPSRRMVRECDPSGAHASVHAQSLRRYERAKARSRGEPTADAQEEEAPMDVDIESSSSIHSLAEVEAEVSPLSAPVADIEFRAAGRSTAADATSVDPGSSMRTWSRAVQTDITLDDTLAMDFEALRQGRGKSPSNPRPAPFSEASLTRDEDVKFFTGLPSVELLKIVFEFVSAGIADTVRQSKLTPFQEFTMALVKLRLNSRLYELAFWTGLSVPTVSRILHKWVRALDTRLGHLINWPDREELQSTMPLCFRKSFGTKVAVILDCFEIFIDRPSNLMARAQTWSQYKHHNTVKVLMGIAPQGVVSFVSRAWGGRVSDKYLTEHCNVFQKLLPGDVVLVDRGFDIEETVTLHGGKLHIPAFTKNRAQLSAVDVHQTRRIANVRIHVERVIGVVRQKFAILNGPLPVDFLQKGSHGDNVPLVDRVVHICCALTNLCESVVPFV